MHITLNALKGCKTKTHHSLPITFLSSMCLKLFTEFQVLLTKSLVNSSTLNCRRVYVKKRGVRQILKKIIEIKKKEKANSVDSDEVACEPSHLDLHRLVRPSLQVCSVERLNKGLAM